jgi:hypothetical protein
MRKSRTRRTANRRAGEVDLRASCSNGESIDRQGFGSRPVGGGRSTAQVGRVPASCSLAAPTSGSTISSLPQGSGAFPAALRRGPSAGRRPHAEVAFLQGRASARGQNVLQKRRLRRSHLRRLRVCRVLDRFLRQRDICPHLALPPVRPHVGNRPTIGRRRRAAGVRHLGCAGGRASDVPTRVTGIASRLPPG